MVSTRPGMIYLAYYHGKYQTISVMILILFYFLVVEKISIFDFLESF